VINLVKDRTTLREHIQKVRGGVRRLLKPLEDPFLSVRDLGFAARAEFRRQRLTPEYQAAFDKPEPLVSICIATYNRAPLLRERSLRSCLKQTYRNIEIIVVGDACTDETAKVMAEVSDPRVRFVNLEQRGDYPDDPNLRWMVAGTAPVNHALSMARGDFITHLDDDDEHPPERVEVLLQALVQNRGDLIYHPFRFETPDGTWLVNQAKSFRYVSATTSSIFYHRHFRSLGWDPLAYEYREPGDWNRLRKIRFLGAKIIRDPRVLLSHYRERNQRTADGVLARSQK
jgi:glycosyltransferase involved in cell wall biosynthesis